MPGGSTTIIIGSGGGQTPKTFAQICNPDGFVVTNSLSEYTSVHYTSPDGREGGVTIQISSGSTIALAGGCVEGIA